MGRFIYKNYKIAYVLLLVILLQAGLHGKLHAQDGTGKETMLGTFKAWTAYRYETSDGPVCTMWSTPTKSSGKYTRRGDVWAFVTHRPDLDRFDEIVYQMGYPIDPNLEVKASVDGKNRFSFFSEGESAFARLTDSKKIVRAMKKGTGLVVKGTSTRGTLTNDRYSLSGFTAAYKAIGKSCPK